MTTYTSALQRLRALPDVFSLKALALTMDITPEAAAVYVHRWQRAGHIESAGPRSGWYFNLLRNPEAAALHRHEVVREIYPTALLRGESVLHAAGWTTQVPQHLAIAVLDDSARSAAINGIEITPRSRRWYGAVRQWRAAEPVYGIDALKPAAALADLFVPRAGARQWHPDPDDLDRDAVQWADVGRAFGALGIDVPEIYRGLVRGYVDIGTQATVTQARKRNARP